MFFWSHRNVHVAFTDDEEMRLVALVEKDVTKRVGYNLYRSSRRRIEKKIFAHLRAALDSDPDGFFRQYVERLETGPHAGEIFRLFLLAYSGITRRAALSHEIRSPDPRDTVPELFLASAEGPAIRVDILAPRPWPLRSAKVLGHLSFPLASIQKIVGRIDNFVLITTSLHVRFGVDHIRISAAS